MTDIHTDYEYETNVSAKCMETTCCRKGSTPRDGDNGLKSGYWGTVATCDIPFRTFD